MKEYPTEKIRNIVLAGQRGCGKTSLADAIAYNAGINSRVGRVDDGSSLLDYTDSEISRQMSLSSKLLACSWKDTKINLIDCPGHSDFIGELLSATVVCDSLAVVVSAPAGVEVGTSIQWRRLTDFKGARFFFVNKIDTENANWKAALQGIKDEFGKQAVAVQLPIGEGSGFKGIIDLLHMKAYEYDEAGERKEIPIPADLKDEADTERENLIEVAAEAQDDLLEKFFDKGTLDDADVLKGLRSGINSGKLFPVLFGSALGNQGVKVMLDFAVEYLPSPDQVPAIMVNKDGSDDKIALTSDSNGPQAAFVYKTMSEGHMGDMSFFRTLSGNIKSGGELKNSRSGSNERITQIYTLQGKNRIDLSSVPAGDIGVLVKLKNTHTGDTLASPNLSISVSPIEYPNPVMDVAITSRTKGDEDKVSTGLHRLNLEDPTFRVVPDAALKQLVLYSQGSSQIDLLTDRLKQRFGVEVELARPRIPYRETVRGKTEKQYKHKKQSGGRGQYGDVHIRIEPNQRGGGFEFVDAIKGGVIPSKFVPAVQKGVVESMVSGGLSGSQVVDVKVTLFYGSYHDVDSSDMAFKIAGLMAFKEGFLDSKPVILEPIYNVEVVVPDEFTGDVMGDLSGRRGKIAGMDPDGRNQIIRATVPQAELYQYSVDLRSMTQGQGMYSLEFSNYEEVPREVAQKIIAEVKAEKEAAA